MADSISNYDDTIDSRQIIERIGELDGERKPLVENVTDAEEALGEVEEDSADRDTLVANLDVAQEALAEWDDSADGEELAALKALAEEAESHADDWQHGATLIRGSYFETYAQEFAEDAGLVKGNKEWPMRHIDWKAAARELKQDYTSVSFNGVDYWVR